MKDNSRRNFLLTSGKLFIATAAVGASSAVHADEHSHHGGSGDGLVIDAATKMTCATCNFWGGMRKVSDDRKQITAQSMGWCNNPDSPNHQKLTAADHKMMKSGIWNKWTVL